MGLKLPTAIDPIAVIPRTSITFHEMVMHVTKLCYHAAARFRKPEVAKPSVSFFSDDLAASAEGQLILTGDYTHNPISGEMARQQLAAPPPQPGCYASAFTPR